MTQQQVEIKKRARKIFGEAQNPIKSIMQDMERDQDLNQNFFLDDNFDYEQKFILKKAIKKRSNKNYSPKKVN